MYYIIYMYIIYIYTYLSWPSLSPLISLQHDLKNSTKKLGSPGIHRIDVGGLQQALQHVHQDRARPRGDEGPSLWWTNKRLEKSSQPGYD